MSTQVRNSGAFDRFASWMGAQAARPWFFAFCVLTVVVWAPSYFLFQTIDTWQLVINSFTTVVTFLLVALLQNTQDRSTKALNHKLDALAEAIALILEDTSVTDDDERGDECITELRRMAGVEMEASD